MGFLPQLWLCCILMLHFSLDVYPSEECIGWLYKNSSCYLVSSVHTQRMRSSILNWTDADDVCQTYGGNLASIREQHQFDFLVEKLALHGVSDSLFWLGGRNEPLGEFHWINGALIKNGFSSWTSYVNHNIEASLTQSCVAMVPSNGFNWQDGWCGQKLGFVCQTDLSIRECNGSTYYVISDKCILISQSTATWFEARNWCLRMGWDLLVVDSLSLQRGIESSLSASSSLILNGYWIGATQTNWKWTDGQDLLFSKFGSKWPRGSWDCLALATKAEGDVHWANVLCGLRLDFICERVLIPYSTTTTTTTTTSTSVPTTTIQPVSTPVARTSTDFTIPSNGGGTSHKQKDKQPSTGYPWNLTEVQFILAVVAVGVVVLLLAVLVAIAVIRSQNKKQGHSRFQNEQEDVYGGAANTSFDASGDAVEPDLIDLDLNPQSHPTESVSKQQLDKPQKGKSEKGENHHKSRNPKNTKSNKQIVKKKKSKKKEVDNDMENSKRSDPSDITDKDFFDAVMQDDDVMANPIYSHTPAASRNTSDERDMSISETLVDLSER